MKSSGVYINDSKKLPTANHSKDLSERNGTMDEIPLEEIHKTGEGSEQEVNQKHESGKFHIVINALFQKMFNFKTLSINIVNGNNKLSGLSKISSIF